MYGYLKSKKKKVWLEDTCPEVGLGEGEASEMSVSDAETEQRSANPLYEPNHTDVSREQLVSDGEWDDMDSANESRSEQEAGSSVEAGDSDDSDVHSGDEERYLSNSPDEDQNYNSFEPWVVKPMQTVYSSDTEIKMKKNLQVQCSQMIPKNLPGFQKEVMVRRLRDAIVL